MKPYTQESEQPIPTAITDVGKHLTVNAPIATSGAIEAVELQQANIVSEAHLPRSAAGRKVVIEQTVFIAAGLAFMLAVIFTVVALRASRRATRASHGLEAQIRADQKPSHARVTIADSSVAAAVHLSVNTRYYQHLLRAIEHALAAKGYGFFPNATLAGLSRSGILDWELRRSVAEHVSRERLTYLWPCAGKDDIEARVADDLADGFAMRWVDDIVRALVEQDFGLEQVMVVPVERRAPTTMRPAVADALQDLMARSWCAPASREERQSL